ncbi:glycine zipper 2TM domain-containing protein [Celeribacter neptunius]|uniref:17 kDa surface antigen n=1 Tax=Celeribacter neptunius TaxID=588602 RepID=A0A1I3JYR8_9RHOB|nr:glycine zipper 2TM domain-containing protein [Celeribacter neptunius]SFI65402.1 Glycine-zipper containing OmpA-like membrane domain-containing protein [Celeribacter neptunius]
MQIHKFLAISATSLGLLAACDRPMDAPYTFDGPRSSSQSSAGYEADLAQCKSLAESYKSEEITQSALAGAAIGGVLGAVDDDNSNELEGAVGGAAVGALVGALSSQDEVRDARRDVVIRCLQGRGYKVIG